MNTISKYLLRFILCVICLLALPSSASAINEPTRCSGTVIDLGFPKKLLSFRDLARPGTCGIKPTKIVVHTTWGTETAEAQFQDFENQTRGASTAFVVGKDGQILQMLELLSDKAEIGWGVGNYNSHAISIEVGHNGNYESRDAAPSAQYNALLELISALMEAYSIPLGDVEYDVVNTGDRPGEGPIDASTLGIFGHYQLNPLGKTDPGRGFLRDVREDIKEGGPFISSNTSSGGGSRSDTSCFITQVGQPTTEKPALPPECSSSGGGSFGPCQEAPAPPSDIKQAIIDKWGITLNLNNFQLLGAWEEFHEIDCTGFLQDLNGTLVNSWGNGYAQQFSCPGTSGNQGETDVMFSNDWNGEFMKAILIHELTHVWQLCTSRGEQNKIGNDEAVGSESWLTNYSRSGGCGFDIDPYKEDHADAIALYLNPEQGELTCGEGRGNPFAGGGFPAHSSNAESAVGAKSTSTNTPVGAGFLPE